MIRHFHFLLAATIVLTAGCRSRDDKKPAEPLPNLNLSTLDHQQDFFKGQAQANVTIEYFADLECGACKAMSPELDAIMEKYPNKIKLVFKNYPKDKSCTNYDGKYLHEYSCEAAIAARCVGFYTQKFWEFKDHLFAHQSEYNEANFKKWAEEFGLSSSQYDECYKSQPILARIKSDVMEGTNRGVTGTPTIFVNGTKIFPASRELIEAEISNHL